MTEDRLVQSDLGALGPPSARRDHIWNRAEARLVQCNQVAFRVIGMWLSELSRGLQSARNFQSYRHVAFRVIMWLSECSGGFQSDHVAFRVIMWLPE